MAAAERDRALGEAGHCIGPIAGVVLAAGLSLRMGPGNKLLLEIDGIPMVRRVVETALAAGLDPVVVVVGHGASEVRGALEGLRLSFVENEAPEAGLSSSLRAGIAAIPKSVSASVVLLGDMPWVDAHQVVELVRAFDPRSGSEICVPIHAGRRGNPILWSARFFAEMSAVEGDVGARALLQRHAGSVCEVAVAGRGVLRDVDTPEMLASTLVDDTG